MKRTLLILGGFFTAAALTAWGIIPTLHLHISHGGSQWWLLALLIPAAIAMTGIGIAAIRDSVTDDIKWQTYQEEQAAAEPRPSGIADVAQALGVWRGAPYIDHPLSNCREER